MRYQLRNVFSDVIEAAKEAGIWQTMNLTERAEIVNYFLGHFDALIKEAGRLSLCHLMTSYVCDGRTPQRAQGGRKP
jgi:hypothetical protein